MNAREPSEQNVGNATDAIKVKAHDFVVYLHWYYVGYVKR